MRRLIIPLLLCFCNIALCSSPAQPVVETSVNEAGTQVEYTIRLASFEASAPASKWDERIMDSGTSDWVAESEGLHQQRRAAWERLSAEINEDLKARGQAAVVQDKLKPFLQPCREMLDRANVTYSMTFSQKGELLQVAFILHLNDAHTGQIPLSEDQCRALFNELRRLNIVSPWEDQDLYRIQWVGRIELD